MYVCGWHLNRTQLPHSIPNGMAGGGIQLKISPIIQYAAFLKSIKDIHTIAMAIDPPRDGLMHRLISIEFTCHAEYQIEYLNWIFTHKHTRCEHTGAEVSLSLLSHSISICSYACCNQRSGIQIESNARNVCAADNSPAPNSHHFHCHSHCRPKITSTVYWIVLLLHYADVLARM